MQHDTRKTTVMIGFIGTQLDSGRTAARWHKWRPTIQMAQMEDAQQQCPVQRMDLLHGPQWGPLAEGVASDIHLVRPQLDVRLHPMDLRDPWDFGEVYTRLYDWARSYPFDTDREQYWVHITTGTHVAQICLFLLVEARVIPGILLQTSPPRGQKHSIPAGDFGSYACIDLNLARYDAIAQRLQQVQHDTVAYLKSGIATRNPRFNQLIAELEQVALLSRAPMLLTGPTGAGKSMLARRVFELRKARHHIQGQLVDVNCATLRGDMAASALFGHTRGAYTGAASTRDGLLRSAHQGVLFLDEIGELGLDEQAMLLKALEDRRFFPVGSDREVASDFQLIAGTNRDLRLLVQQGRFREDLWARLNIWHYHLPGLAQRREDIDPNIDYQLAVAEQELGRHVRFQPRARAAYLAFALSDAALWSGNFRDLAASILRMATLAADGTIGPALVQAEIQRLHGQWHGTPADSGIQASGWHGGHIGHGSQNGQIGGDILGGLSVPSTGMTSTGDVYPLLSPQTATAHDGPDRMAPSAPDPAEQRREQPMPGMPAPGTPPSPLLARQLLGETAWAGLDLFDQMQLQAVLHVCASSHSLSEAGRRLFAVSRTRRSTPNDADRLRKYLARFGLDWQTLQFAALKQSP